MRSSRSCPSTRAPERGAHHQITFRGGEIGPLQRRNTEVAKHPVEHGEGKSIRRQDFDPNGFSITAEVNCRTGLNPLSPMASVSCAARQTKICREGSPVPERHFEIRLVHLSIPSPTTLASDAASSYRSHSTRWGEPSVSTISTRSGHLIRGDMPGTRIPCKKP